MLLVGAKPSELYAWRASLCHVGVLPLFTTDDDELLSDRDTRQVETIRYALESYMKTMVLKLEDSVPKAITLALIDKVGYNGSWGYFLFKISIIIILIQLL